MPGNDTTLLNSIIEWDVQNWSRALGLWSTVLDGKKDLRVLCLGERNGGLSLWFALLGHKVVCSDFGGPKKAAHVLHSQYGVSAMVSYENIDVFAIPYGDNTFDIVACKSVIGGLKLVYSDRSTRTLGNQKRAVEEIRRVLKPGGYFMGAENMIGSWLHKIARRIRNGEHTGWRHMTCNELLFMLGGFRQASVKYAGFVGTYYPWMALNTITAVIDSVLSRILPANWLYISFFVGTK